MSGDEFRFLPDDAKRVHRLAPLPRMQRTTKYAPSGRAVSAIVTRDLLARRDSPVVFLHGAGLNAHSFDPTILALGENAISIDLPGHGRSAWRNDARYTPERMAPDVAYAISTLTDRPFHLVGHSLGGLTAAALFDEIGHRTVTVTLIDVTPGISPQRDAKNIVDFVTGRRSFPTIDDIIDRAIAYGIGSDRAALRRGVELNTRVRSDGMIEWAHHFAHLDAIATSAHADGGGHPYAALWDRLSPLKSRVSLIRGSQGLVTDNLQSEWRNRLTQSEIYTIEGGHNLHEHAPRELATVLAHIQAK